MLHVKRDQTPQRDYWKICEWTQVPLEIMCNGRCDSKMFNLSGSDSSRLDSKPWKSCCGAGPLLIGLPLSQSIILFGGPSYSNIWSWDNVIGQNELETFLFFLSPWCSWKGKSHQHQWSVSTDNRWYMCKNTELWDCEAFIVPKTNTHPQSTRNG